MPDAPINPTILILGGLAQQSAIRRIAFVRIVDKSLVIPAADAYTTYVDTAMRKSLKEGTRSGVVEYLQGNLTTEATRSRAFTLPEAHGGAAKSFDYVFDFNGEEADAKDVVHIERTLRLALLLGHDAAKHSVGAYIRVLTSFYKPVDSGKGKVGSKGVVSEPWGTRASWYHEAGRGLAQIKGLKLVLIRPAMPYGMYGVTGVTPQVLIAECYRYQGEKFELLWGENLAQHTIHNEDFASACVATAAWAYKVSSADLLALAREELPTTLKSNDLLKGVDGAAKMEDKVTAPVINIVDRCNTTQGTLVNAIAPAIGVDFGFHNALVSSFAKMNLGDVLEDVNEKHLESWSELLAASKPPMSTTVPISPNIVSDQLQPFPINFDGERLYSVVGWEPKHTLTADVIRDTVSKFREEGHWPNAAPKFKK